MKTPKTQLETIAQHLRRRGKLSTLEAKDRYSIMHPGARICELRQLGWKIWTVTVRPRNGRPHKQWEMVS